MTGDRMDKIPFCVPESQSWIMNPRIVRSGIYRILNRVNGKSYIGSAKNISIRFAQHSVGLRKNKHFNVYLQNSFNKYGYVFDFSCIEECEEYILEERENYYIALFNSRDHRFGYNLQSGRRDDPISRWNDSVRKKISESNKENFRKNPNRGKVSSARLIEWHKAHPGVAGGPRKIYTLMHPLHGQFTGSIMDLRRKYPNQSLHQGALWSVVNRRKWSRTHKGWSVIS